MTQTHHFCAGGQKSQLQLFAEATDSSSTSRPRPGLSRTRHPRCLLLASGPQARTCQPACEGRYKHTPAPSRSSPVSHCPAPPQRHELRPQLSPINHFQDKGCNCLHQTDTGMDVISSTTPAPLGLASWAPAAQNHSAAGRPKQGQKRFKVNSTWQTPSSLWEDPGITGQPVIHPGGSRALHSTPGIGYSTSQCCANTSREGAQGTCGQDRCGLSPQSGADDCPCWPPTTQTAFSGSHRAG